MNFYGCLFFTHANAEGEERERERERERECVCVLCACVCVCVCARACVWCNRAGEVQSPSATALYKNIDMLVALHYEIRNQATNQPTQRTTIIRAPAADCVNITSCVQTQWNHELIAVMCVQC